jgi:hypothetical protein
MSKSWKIIKTYEPLIPKEIIKKLKNKNYILSEWIEDVFKNYKSEIKKGEYPLCLYKIKVRDLKINRPTTLRIIYKKLKKNGFKLVPPELALFLRSKYREQKTGEWLRFATPFKSLIDSDGVPHLPKLGKALNKYFIETYWSYPKAIFHPHNEFVVLKKNVKKNKNK